MKEVLEESCGIYCIENKIDNKKYIGKSTVKIKYRINNHVKKLNNNNHENKHLQRAWNKYGEENFYFWVVIVCKKEDLSKQEKFFINKYKSNDKNFGYNLTDGGEGIITSRKRVILEETKLKISNSLKGKRSGSLNGFYGKKHRKESILKISIAKKEYHKNLSEEEKEKINKNLEKGRGKSFWTNETYIKLSLKSSGENSGTNKLLETEVIEILKSEKTMRELSEMYNVTIGTISRIKSGKRWSYLKERHPELYE